MPGISPANLRERTSPFDLVILVFASSAYIGIQNGIKRLSNINIFLVLIFLLLVLIIGPTSYIFDNSVETIIFYTK